jgi:hypothetical protein
MAALFTNSLFEDEYGVYVFGIFFVLFSFIQFKSFTFISCDLLYTVLTITREDDMSRMGFWRLAKKRVCKIECYMYHLLLRETEVNGNIRNAVEQPE